MQEYIVHITEGAHDRLASVNSWSFPSAARRHHIQNGATMTVAEVMWSPTEQRFVVCERDYSVEGGEVRDSRGICVGHTVFRRA